MSGRDKLRANRFASVYTCIQKTTPLQGQYYSTKGCGLHPKIVTTKPDVKASAHPTNRLIESYAR